MIEGQKVQNESHKSQGARKWACEEIDRLIVVVQDIDPQNNKGWKEVSLRMHSHGSRRRPCDYKAKFLSIKAKQQRDSIKQNHKIHQQICEHFQLGKSVNEISQTIQIINAINVETILNGFFSNIRRVLKKIVGIQKLKEIRAKDHQLFGFIRKNELQLESITKIITLCNCWKELKVSKQTFKQKDSEKYKKIKNNIEKKLEKFNYQLTDYSDRFNKQEQMEVLKEELSMKSKTSNKTVQKSLTLPSLYIKNISQFPYQFKSSHLFKHSNDDQSFDSKAYTFNRKGCSIAPICFESQMENQEDYDLSIYMSLPNDSKFSAQECPTKNNLKLNFDPSFYEQEKLHFTHQDSLDLDNLL